MNDQALLHGEGANKFQQYHGFHTSINYHPHKIMVSEHHVLFICSY